MVVLSQQRMNQVTLILSALRMLIKLTAFLIIRNKSLPYFLVGKPRRQLILVMLIFALQFLKPTRFFINYGQIVNIG